MPDFSEPRSSRWRYLAAAAALVLSLALAFTRHKQAAHHFLPVHPDKVSVPAAPPTADRTEK